MVYWWIYWFQLERQVFSINSYNQWRKRIKITVRSPPKKGKANQEIIQEFTSLTQHEVKIVSGIKKPGENYQDFMV